MVASTSNKRQPGNDGSNAAKRSVPDKSGSTSTQRLTGNDPEPRPLNDSPLKRVKRAVERAANKRVIDNVDDLKKFILEVDPTGSGVPASATVGIVLRMRVAWTSFDTCSTGPVARLRLIDQSVEEDIAEIHKVMRDDYGANRSAVDAEVVTASLFGVDADTAGIPEDGATVVVTRMWSLKMFAKNSCQLSTSILSLRVDAPKAEGNKEDIQRAGVSKTDA